MREMTCTCGKPTRDDAYVCEGCTNQLVRALADVGWLTGELETAITRQKAAAITGSAPSATQPLPFHEKASDVAHALHGMLSTWVRFCVDESIKGAPAKLPSDRNASLAAWLLACTKGLVLRDFAPQALDELTDVIASARRVVFWKRRTRVYLGPCAYGNGIADALAADCPGDVYADEGEPVGHCEECERGVTVVIRQGELNDDLRSRLLSAADIADWTVRMGLDAPREAVRKRVLYWHRHKRITAASHDMLGETRIPLFRYAEVEPLILGEYGEQAG